MADIKIPTEKLECRYSRSSGPGGQHVNKTNSKAEIRFKVTDADWISDRGKKNLFKNYDNYINKEGEFIITDQTSRTQNDNLQEAIYKLRQIILDCSQPDKKEFIIPPPTINMKQNIIEKKRQRSTIKQTRQNKSDDY